MNGKNTSKRLISSNESAGLFITAIGFIIMIIGLFIAFSFTISNGGISLVVMGGFIFLGGTITVGISTLLRTLIEFQ